MNTNGLEKDLNKQRQNSGIEMRLSEVLTSNDNQQTNQKNTSTTKHEGTLSSVKKKVFPFRNINVNPINISALLKELDEDGDDLEEDIPKLNKDDSFVTSTKTFCDEVKKPNPFAEIKENISPHKKSIDCKAIEEYQTNSVNNVKKCLIPSITICTDVEKPINPPNNELQTNIPPNKNLPTTYNQSQNSAHLVASKSTVIPKAEDSFELDLSVLVSPAKGRGDILATPIGKRPDHEFVTPRMNPPRIQFSAKKELPIHRSSGKKTMSKLKDRIDGFFNMDNKLDCLNTISEENRLLVKGVEYMILNRLGRGGSSEVFLCQCVDDEIYYAIKCVSLHDPVTAQGYLNEVEILGKLQNCERIIKMKEHEYLKEEKKLYVVLEKGGEDMSTILKHLALKKSHISVHTLLFYWMEMLYAVREIHKNGIVHSDLKPANFIQAGGGLKLIDFGISRCMQMDMTSVIKTNPEGSCNYMSPEALKNETSTNLDSPNYGKNKFKINFKSDVWSLGCILYQFVYRKTPFQHISQVWSKLMTIVDSNHKIEYPDAPWVPQKIINTIKSCLQYEKNKRPSVNQLISEYEHSLLHLP